MSQYQETIAAKRQQAAQQHKEQSELGAMLAELKKMQMASLMGSQGKSTVILTDQTDLGDKLKGMVEDFAAAVQATDTTSLSREQVAELKILQSGIKELKSAVLGKKADNGDIVRAIQALDLNVAAPIVNVPEQKAPIVKVAAPDLRPLQDTIERHFPIPEPMEQKLDLSSYRAHDITESGDKQYIGFVNPDGAWYIIENDMKQNAMRYLFGGSKYAKAFKKAATYQYYTLDEAISSATA